jgi:hypothetical protein
MEGLFAQLLVLVLAVFGGMVAAGFVNRSRDRRAIQQETRRRLYSAYLHALSHVLRTADRAFSVPGDDSATYSATYMERERQALDAAVIDLLRLGDDLEIVGSVEIRILVSVVKEAIAGMRPATLQGQYWDTALRPLLINLRIHLVRMARADLGYGSRLETIKGKVSSFVRRDPAFDPAHLEQEWVDNNVKTP